MPVQPGETLQGQYTVVSQIGRGGFGFVYLAQDTLLGDRVAIKELIPALVGDEGTLKRFLAEAKATIRLRHERIVGTQSVFTQDGNYYIVMEYMRGGSLEERLRRTGALPVGEAAQIAADVAEGLAYAHARGIVHCDLKPANILFDAGEPGAGQGTPGGGHGRAKVADFGIAYVSDQMLSRTWHTPAGFVAGTLPYMSPEQADGVRDDPRVDVYALGAVLYRMLTGRTYLDFDQRETPGAQADNVYGIRNQAPSPPSAINRGVPAGLDAIVLKCLAKRPEDRFSNVTAVHRALTHAGGSRPPAAARPPVQAPQATVPYAPTAARAAPPPTPVPSQPAPAAGTGAAPHTPPPATPGQAAGPSATPHTPPPRDSAAQPPAPAAAAYAAPPQAARPAAAEKGGCLSQRPWILVVAAILVFAVIVCLVVVMLIGGAEPDPAGTPEARVTTVTPVTGGSANATPEGVVTVVVTSGSLEKTVTQEPGQLTPSLPTAAPVAHTGGWLDTLVAVAAGPEDAGALLHSGDLDLYAGDILDLALQLDILGDDALKASTSLVINRELLLNPYGPEFETGELNPFANAAIRESMNWLVDRQGMVDDYLMGQAYPKVVPLTYGFPDHARTADVVADLEARYDYDPDRAMAVIEEEMQALGAGRVDGQWEYNGQPVVLRILVRMDDERSGIGDDVAYNLQNMGFAVEPMYVSAGDALDMAFSGDPAAGEWHAYTGGWIETRLDRDQSRDLRFFYTPDGWAPPVWEAMDASPEMIEIAERLYYQDYASLDERQTLLEEGLYAGLQDSPRIWLMEKTAVSPRRPEVEVAADWVRGVTGSDLWPQTLRREGEVGGEMMIGLPRLDMDPKNPLAGTFWTDDGMLIRATSDSAVLADPGQGLNWPHRLAGARVAIEAGVPMQESLGWASLDVVPENTIPGDTWVDWDAYEQRFLTASEVYTDSAWSYVKVVCDYGSEIHDTTWHDGSPFSIADVVMAMVLRFDRGYEESALFDLDAADALDRFYEHFMGWRIASEDPLVVEFYTDQFNIDAENNVTDLACAYPFYDTGPGAWHALALGILAEESGQAAFSEEKAGEMGVEWLDYTGGPSLGILDGALDFGEGGLYPYAQALDPYLTVEELEERWANLRAWYAETGHFWVGTGPYTLREVTPDAVVLGRYEAYPDPADRWLGR